MVNGTSITCGKIIAGKDSWMDGSSVTDRFKHLRAIKSANRLACLNGGSQLSDFMRKPGTPVVIISELEHLHFSSDAYRLIFDTEKHPASTAQRCGDYEPETWDLSRAAMVGDGLPRGDLRGRIWHRKEIPAGVLIKAV